MPSRPVLGAEIDDRHVDARRRRIKNLVGVGKPDRHRIDQDIAVIAGVKTHLPAHRGHAERIAVAADARDDATHQMPRLRMLGRTERQRVEAGDRPRPHGEHVAQDAADAGGRALIGLDVARMVVALHLEHHRLPVADVDHAGVLARPLDHPWRLGRQPAQMDARGFVGAVLVPHRREDAELGETRHPADQFQDARVFVRLEAVRRDEFGGDLGFVGNHDARRRFKPLIRDIKRTGKALFTRVFNNPANWRDAAPAKHLREPPGSDLRASNNPTEGLFPWTI